MKLTKKRKEALRYILNAGLTDIFQGSETEKEIKEANELNVFVKQFINEYLNG